MQTRPIALAAAALLACATFLPAEVREFRDAKGRTLKAELVKARGTNVVIRNAEGKEVPVPLKNFSRDDITYICRWIAADPAALDYRFDVRETEKAVDKIPGLGRPSGPAAYGTAEETMRAYELSISNRCQNPVEGVRACYRVFLVDCVDASESGYAFVATKRKLLFKTGDVELPVMSYNASHKLTTRAHAVHKMKAANNFNGVSERDRMRGVWVKFYRHGVEVGEYKSGTVPRCEWPESKEEKAALEEDKERQKPLLAALTAPLTEPVKPAPAPRPAAKPKVEPKDDLPEEMKIFDLEDIAEETKVPPAKAPVK
jgi:hypothetical protein